MLKEYIRINKRRRNADFINREIVGALNILEGDYPGVRSHLLNIKNTLIDRNPIGVILADKINGEVVMGWSLCHRTEDKYDKKLGDQQAMDRLNGLIPNDPLPQSILKRWSRMKQRAEVS